MTDFYWQDLVLFLALPVMAAVIGLVALVKRWRNRK